MHPCVLKEERGCLKEGKGLVNPDCWLVAVTEVNPRDCIVLFRILKSLQVFPFSMEKMMSHDVSAL